MKRCSLLLLTLAIVSCAPPYSAELNASAGLAKQMILLSTLGPVNSPDGDSTTAIKFLPIKPTATMTSLDEVSSTSGFLISESSGNESLSFAFQDSGGKVQTVNGGASFPLAGADPNYPLYQYDIITPTASIANILVFKIAPSLTLGTAQLFSVNLASNQFQSPSASPNPQNFDVVFPVLSGKPLVGVDAFVVAGAEQFGFLFDNGFLNDAYGTATLDGLTTVFSIPGSFLTGSVEFPATQKRVLFYTNGQPGAAIRSYGSYYDEGQWVCYQWSNTALSTVLLPGITHRIDGLLSNGDFISTEDATLTIYDPNGTEVNSVPLGGMQFCYEAYVGPTPYVFFSLPMEFSHNSWVFRVYAIPTFKLRGLKG